MKSHANVRPSPNVAYLLEAGDKALRRRDYDEALECYNTAIKLSKNDIDLFEAYLSRVQFHDLLAVIYQPLGNKSHKSLRKQTIDDCTLALEHLLKTQGNGFTYQGLRKQLTAIYMERASKHFILGNHKMALVDCIKAIANSSNKSEHCYGGSFDCTRFLTGSLMYLCSREKKNEIKQFFYKEILALSEHEQDRVLTDLTSDGILTNCVVPQYDTHHTLKKMRDDLQEKIQKRKKEEEGKSTTQKAQEEMVYSYETNNHLFFSKKPAKAAPASPKIQDIQDTYFNHHFDTHFGL